MIMVKDLSRLGRNHIEVNKYIEDIFPSLNVRVFSINDNYDKIVEDVINLINVYEIDIPFVDERTNSEIYRLNSKQIIKNKRR